MYYGKISLGIGRESLSFHIYEYPCNNLNGHSLFIIGAKEDHKSIKVFDVGHFENIKELAHRKNYLNCDLILVCELKSFRDALVALGHMSDYIGKSVIFDIETHLKEMREASQ